MCVQAHPATGKIHATIVSHRFTLGFTRAELLPVIAELLGVLALLAIAAILAVLLMTVLLIYNVRHPPRNTAGLALARGRPCDPADIGLPFEEWTFDRPGARLPVWEVDVRNDQQSDRSQPDGPLTVVFVHGWGQSRLSMLNRLEPFDECGDRLVMYDLRGHGEATGGLTPLGWREDDDLLALLDRLGGSRYLLVGNSMGAVIALHAAARTTMTGNRVVGVVAYGLYADFHRSVRGRLRLQNLPRRPMTDLAMVWFRLSGVRFPSIKPAASAIRCPILLLHGSDDLVAPIEHAQRVADAAADAELVVIEGGTHLDAHEVDPDTHGAAVRRFIDRIG
jgi:pimeloyl-ACP methyl ester carboxylesterase